MIGSWKTRLRCIAIGVACLVGCGEKGPFEYMPVQGKLTYEDGSTIPAGGMLLQFKAIDAKPVGNLVPRPAQAQLDADGKFTCATSYKFGDGLIPGKHKVAIQYATDAKGNLLIPRDYTSLGSTPLIIDTGDGNIEMKVSRP